MNVNTLHILIAVFPFLPLLGIIASLAGKYIFIRDITRFTVTFQIFLQAAAGILLLTLFLLQAGRASGSREITVMVSELPFSIRFAFSYERIWFLCAFLIPLFFAVFKVSSLKGDSLRTAFLFYLTGSSGIIVTGDVFNFFVFFELMIMSAYILISVNRKYYASIKYMLIGAVSSCFFLAGIIFLYSSGLSFAFTALRDLSGINPLRTKLILVCFSAAFMIKSAVFPASSWLPTCHGAANSTVSAFLSSFSVAAGFFGLYHLVIIPAGSVSVTLLPEMLKVLALITIAAAGLFIFFETDMKRCIAGSTVFASGFISFLFASGKTDAALIYLVIHAFYKSFLFHIADDFNKSTLSLRGRRISFTAGGILLLFAGGIFPSAGHFLKSSAGTGGPEFYAVFYTAVALMFGGFLKFSLTVSRRKIQRWTYITGAAAGVSLYLVFIYPGFAGPLYGNTLFHHLFQSGIKTYILEAAVIPLAWIAGRFVFPKISRLSNLDTRFIFRNLSIELFMTVLLSAVLLAVLAAPG